MPDDATRPAAEGAAPETSAAPETEAAEEVYDVVIVGAGIAGLAAAIYTTRERLSTLLLEKQMPGGQILLTARVENYPGFPEPINGMELADRLTQQARRFGACRLGTSLEGVWAAGDARANTLKQAATAAADGVTAALNAKEYLKGRGTHKAGT